MFLVTVSGRTFDRLWAIHVRCITRRATIGIHEAMRVIRIQNFPRERAERHIAGSKQYDGLVDHRENMYMALVAFMKKNEIT